MKPHAFTTQPDRPNMVFRALRIFLSLRSPLLLLLAQQEYDPSDSALHGGEVPLLTTRLCSALRATSSRVKPTRGALHVLQNACDPLRVHWPFAQIPATGNFVVLQAPSVQKKATWLNSRGVYHTSICCAWSKKFC